MAASTGSLSEVNSLLNMGVSPDGNCGSKTSLGQAAEKGHYRCVETLLNAGAQPNFTTDSITPFMRALRADQHMCISTFLSRGALVNLLAVDFNKTSTMMYASRSGNVKVSLDMIERFGKGILYCKDSYMENILSYAASNGHKEYVHQIIPFFAFENSLVRAVVEDNYADLITLLRQGADPNIKDFGGLTALSVSCMLNRRRCFDVLLKSDVTLNSWDESGRMAIHYAAANDNVYMFQKLLSVGAVVAWTNRQRENSLAIAAKSGSSNCVSIALTEILLYENKMFSKINNPNKQSKSFFLGDAEGDHLVGINSADYSSKSPLIHAAEKGHLLVVQMLIDAGVMVNGTACHAGMTPLMYASSFGHTQIVAELLGIGAKVNVTDHNDYSPLCHAAINGHLPSVLLLLQAGSEILPQKNTKPNVLIEALENGHSECAAAMIQVMTHAQLATRDHRGRNGMLFAAKNGDINCLKLFFNAGFELSTADLFGNTLLMYATTGCHPECIRFLIEEMGMSVNDKNNSGLNALSYSVYYNLPLDIIKYLIDAGSEISPIEKCSGDYPLIYACQNGNACKVKLLLSRGSLVYKRNKSGISPLNYASAHGNANVVNLILEAEKLEGVFETSESHRKSMLYAVSNGNVKVVNLFLKLGFYRWEWFPFIAWTIRTNRRLLVRALVSFGISPCTFVYNEEPSSPLILALNSKDIGTIKYLISNLYFTDLDFTNILKNAHFSFGLECQNEDDFLCNTRTILSKSKDLQTPPSLTTLSFLIVSWSISSHCGIISRVQAVERLPIPDILKRKLAFQEPIARLCEEEWRNIDIKQPVRGYGQRDLSLFLKLTKMPQPYGMELFPCKNHCCSCRDTGSSFNMPFQFQFQC